MEQSKPLISVLISVKNGGPKFDLTMESIAAQTIDRPLFEVLVCNNNSTDHTSDLIEKWQEKGICKLITEDKPSANLTEALVELARQAAGKYLVRVDVGDVCSPERLSRQLTYLERHSDVGMVCSTSLLMLQNQKIVGPLFSPFLKEVKLKHLLRKNIIVHGSIMMRKAAYEVVGGYDVSYNLAEDFDLWTRMLSRGIKIHWLKEPLYLYELDENGISSTKTEGQARLTGQIRNRYKKIGPSPVKSKATDLNRMRRNATLRGLPGLGRVVRIIEGLLFEIECK